MEAPKRAVIYTRVSDEKQSKEDRYSLPEQLDKGRAHCAERGYMVAREVREIHSGSWLDERPKMTEIREMARRREFDVLVVTVLDRLARDADHQTVVIYEMGKYRIAVECVEESYDDSPMGKHVRHLMGLLAEIEKKNIVRRTQGGIRKRVESGKMLPSSQPLYGYAWADGSRAAYAIWEETAAVVRRIFESIARGIGARKLAQILTEEGILTPRDWWRQYRGKPTKGEGWSRTTIFNIIHNPAYDGHYTAFRWSKTQQSVYDPVTQTSRVQRSSTIRPEGDAKRVEMSDIAPAIVSEEIAQQARERLKINQQEAARHNPRPDDSLLRGGIAKCGLCGANMIVRHGALHEYKKTYYRCSRYNSADHIRCRNQIGAVHIDADVWAGVHYILTHRDYITDEITRRQEKASLVDDQIERIDKRLAEISQEERDIADGVARMRGNTNILDMLAVKSQKLAEEREQKGLERKRLQSAHAQQAEIDGLLGEMEEWYGRVAVAFKDKIPYELKRLALRALRVEVMVHAKDDRPRYEAWAEVGGERVPVLLPDPEPDPESGIESRHCVSDRL